MDEVKADNLSREVQVAAAIAREAGAAIMRYHREGGYAVERKADDSPVTAADKAANEIILRGLREHFPYPILSEESPDDPVRLASDVLWIVDPLDGTRAFTIGQGGFSVLIGLARHGRPISGVAYFPLDDRLYLAEEGRGAWISEAGAALARVRTVSPADPHQAVLVVGSGGREDTPVLHEAGFARVEYAPGFGARIIAVASGAAHAHVNVTVRASEWDTCAPEVILEEAGGVITDPAGKAYRYNKPVPKQEGGIVAASDAVVHAVALAEIVPALTRER